MKEDLTFRAILIVPALRIDWKSGTTEIKAIYTGHSLSWLHAQNCIDYLSTKCKAINNSKITSIFPLNIEVENEVKKVIEEMIKKSSPMRQSDLPNYFNNEDKLANEKTQATDGIKFLKQLMPTADITTYENTNKMRPKFIKLEKSAETKFKGLGPGDKDRKCTSLVEVSNSLSKKKNLPKNESVTNTSEANASRNQKLCQVSAAKTSIEDSAPRPQAFHYTSNSQPVTENNSTPASLTAKVLKNKRQATTCPFLLKLSKKARSTPIAQFKEKTIHPNSHTSSSPQNKQLGLPNKQCYHAQLYQRITQTMTENLAKMLSTHNTAFLHRLKQRSQLTPPSKLENLQGNPQYAQDVRS